MVARLIHKLTAPLARRVRLLARRAVVRLVYDDAKMQELQLAIFSGEVRDGVERWEDYGFTSHPPPGAEAIVLALGGNTDHGAVIKVADRRYRLTALAAGEVALYDDQGQVIHFKRDKTIHIYGCDPLTADIGVAATITCPLVTLVASTKVTMTTPLLEVSGAITAGTNIIATGQVYDDGGAKSMSGMRSVYNNHQHNDPVSGQTSTPSAAM